MKSFMVGWKFVLNLRNKFIIFSGFENGLLKGVGCGKIKSILIWCIDL